MAVKQCSKCSEVKPIDQFYKRRSGRVETRCKSCHVKITAEYAKNHREQILETQRRWRRNNPEKSREHTNNWAARNRERVAKRTKEWALKNKDRMRSLTSEWGKRNRGKTRFYCSQRFAALLNATPSWADNGKILSIYTKASKLGYEVDHIVPLQSNVVCGLHCEFNLQLLPLKENRGKSNRYWPDMP